MLNKNTILLLIICILLKLNLSAQYHKNTRQPYGVNFEHITLEDGLSQSSVNIIFQDSFGFLWFGTQDGLNRYDGYNFIIYNPIHKDTTSISDNQIWAICEDSDRNLWIGTYNGLNKFDRKNETFKRYNYSENNSNSISNNQVRSLFADHNNQIWIGTKEGLDVLNYKTGIFKHYKNSPNDTNSISGNYIRGFCTDNFDRLWIITDNQGANIYIPEKDNFLRYKLLEPKDTRSILCDNDNNIWFGTNENGLYKATFVNENQSSVQKISNYPNNNVLSIIQDKQEVFWISSVDGLFRYDSETDEFTQYNFDENNPKSLNDNYIWQVFEDKTGILWLGTYAGGICKYDKSKNKFNHYQITFIQDNIINANFIRSFTKDYNNNLWVGSKAGLFKFIYNKKSNTYEQVSYITKNKLGDNYIRQILTDSLGNIWIATNSDGIAYLNLSEKNPYFSFFRNEVNNPNSLSSNNIRTIYLDNSNNLWIGTIDKGLNKMYFEKNKVYFERFEKSENGLTDNYIRTIFQDKSGIYWIGTENGGLNKFNYKTYEFTEFWHDEFKNSISSNTITNIFEDSNGNLWFGTYGGGLNLLMSNDTVFQIFNTTNSISNNFIYGILEDNSKNLWISTNNGLLKFNIEIYNVTNYGIWDGLQSNEFNTGAFYKAADGEMFFGGINGFNSFYPEDVISNKFYPDIVITDFKIFNKSITPKDSIKIIDKSILYIDKIDLTYNQNVITIEFSAMHFSNPERNQYKYKLEGIDEEWIIITDKNYASYNHLPPGEYSLIVKSSNCDGLWSNYFEILNITIHPPFYETKLFKILVGLGVLLILLLIFFIRTSVLKKQKWELEKQVLFRTYEINKQKNKIVKINEELEQRHEEILAQAEMLSNHNEQLSKLSLVASNTSNSIMIMNNKAEIEWVNESFTTIYGLTINDLEEKFRRNMIEISVIENISELVERCVKLGQVINYESFINRPDSSKIWVQTTLSPIFNGFGDVIKIIAIESDISELKNAEMEIMQKNEEIKAQKEALIQQNEEIFTTKQELERINEQLEIQNESIKGSIRTALTIQQAILPKTEEIQENFECFIFFQPKDIVSGDFYWYVHLAKKENLTEKFFIAVADCTGHGVPGAFMSMIGSRILNEIVNQRHIFQPSEILETLNLEIIKALKQDKTDNTDGMDICLCYIEKQYDNKNILTFSGARRDLLYYDSFDKILKILKSDRKAIGGTFSKLKQNFSDQRIFLSENETIYLHTDGFTDQIGLEGFKFGSTKLRDILIQNIELNMEQQKKLLVKALKNWQADELQRDDMTIIGLKIK